jgi:hypothetical protein
MVYLLRASLFSLLCMGSVYGQVFGDRLHLLKKGDELIYDFQQSITLVRVLDTADATITLRVATATKDVAEREGFSSWLMWADSGCPGAATDETLQLHIDGQPAVVSSDTQRAGWLITLLRLTSTPVPEKARRRAGPAPMPEEIDLRSPWHPRIVVDGQNVGGPCDAYSFQWPTDDSPLSGRMIIAYFPRSSKAVPALPYWIESPSSSVHVSVIDSHKIG